MGLRQGRAQRRRELGTLPREPAKPGLPLGTASSHAVQPTPMSPAERASPIAATHRSHGTHASPTRVEAARRTLLQWSVVAGRWPHLMPFCRPNPSPQLRQASAPRGSSSSSLDQSIRTGFSPVHEILEGLAGSLRAAEKTTAAQRRPLRARRSASLCQRELQRFAPQRELTRQSTGERAEDLVMHLQFTLPLRGVDTGDLPEALPAERF